MNISLIEKPRIDKWTHHVFFYLLKSGGPEIVSVSPHRMFEASGVPRNSQKICQSNSFDLISLSWVMWRVQIENSGQTIGYNRIADCHHRLIEGIVDSLMAFSIN